MPSNTIPVKWLQDKNGNEFYPVTHKNAIRDDNGNSIAIPEVLDDLNDVVITNGVTNAQTYFENAVQDYDGNWYDAIILGDQVWMAENLRTTHYADGTAITTYYFPNNNSSNFENYGLLYNWNTIMNGANSSNTNPSGIQGIAPNGWHIPSQTEWQQMLTWVGQQSEYISNNNSTYIAKALASTTGWNTSSTDYAVGNNQSANNATGFNVVPAGFYGANSYQKFGENAFLWSTSGSESYYNGLAINYNTVSVSSITSNPGIYFYSVRCLYNGTASQFREQMAARSLQNQILKHDGNHWVNTDIPQSDWGQNDSTAGDYIKNRTHYATKTDYSLVLTGEIVEYDISNIDSSENCILVEFYKGSKDFEDLVSVTINGIDIQLGPLQFSEDFGVLYYGNLHIGSDNYEDTGEDFLIVDLDVINESESYFSFLGLTSVYGSTFSGANSEVIIKQITSVKKLDQMYIDHDFTFDSETVSTSSATVTFGASQRGTHFIAAEDDFSITFSVNNESDNYLWIRNTGNSAIQIYIQDVTHNGSRVQNIYMPEDDIIIQPGYASEIGIVCNSVGAFITTRCDLRYTSNSPSV